MPELKLTDCQKKLTPADLALVEQAHRIKLPQTFRNFYWKHNGGSPDRTTWVDPAAVFDHIELRGLPLDAVLRKRERRS